MRSMSEYFASPCGRLIRITHITCFRATFFTSPIYGLRRIPISGHESRNNHIISTFNGYLNLSPFPSLTNDRRMQFSLQLDHIMQFIFICILFSRTGNAAYKMDGNGRKYSVAFFCKTEIRFKINKLKTLKNIQIQSVFNAVVFVAAHSRLHQIFATTKDESLNSNLPEIFGCNLGH